MCIRDRIKDVDNPTNSNFIMRIPKEEGGYPIEEYIELVALDNSGNIDSDDDALFYGAVCLDTDVSCTTALNITKVKDNNIQGSLIGTLDFEVLNQNNSIEQKSLNMSCTFSLRY